MNKVPRRVRDLTGLKFGRLTAISRYNQPGISIWKCQCSCGCFKDVSADHLQRSIVQSCGCLRFGIPDMQAYTRDDTARDRGLVLAHVQMHPGDTCKEVAEAMARPKTTIYEHLNALEGEGKIVKRTTFKGESKVRCLGYYVDERERVTRFDYPNQKTVAAIDKAKLPDPDPILAAFFGK